MSDLQHGPGPVKKKASAPDETDYTPARCTVREIQGPGKCPICSMDLVPVKAQNRFIRPTSETGGNTNMVEQPSEFTVPVSRQQLIGVTYCAR